MSRDMALAPFKGGGFLAKVAKIAILAKLATLAEPEEIAALPLSGKAA